MTIANISYARNHLSELINRVREGETVLIMDRHTPVARLEPMDEFGPVKPEWKADLVRRHVVQPARRRLDVKALLASPPPVPRDGPDILAALQADREESR